MGFKGYDIGPPIPLAPRIIKKCVNAIKHKMVYPQEL
jgi:hypothetical protein